MTSGKVERIWIKRCKRGPMDSVLEAEAREGRGLLGNADQGGRRQVTLISSEAFAAVSREMEREVDPVLRRANVLVSGLDLENSRGRLLQAGGLKIRVEGETKPCERMDEALAGLKSALSPQWRGGAYGVVLTDGTVRVGDVVRWVEG